MKSTRSKHDIHVKTTWFVHEFHRIPLDGMSVCFCSLGQLLVVITTCFVVKRLVKQKSVQHLFEIRRSVPKHIVFTSGFCPPLREPRDSLSQPRPWQKSLVFPWTSLNVIRWQQIGLIVSDSWNTMTPEMLQSRAKVPRVGLTAPCTCSDAANAKCKIPLEPHITAPHPNALPPTRAQPTKLRPPIIKQKTGKANEPTPRSTSWLRWLPLGPRSQVP